MTKEEFFSKLEGSLKKLPTEERQDILQDFEEHFAIGLEEGKTEEEITASLGSPHQIAKDMVATYHLEKAGDTASTGNIIRAVWAVIGLGFFNLVIVLGPFIGIVAIMIAGWTVGISFLATPVLVLIHSVIYPESFHFFYLFLSMVICGLGVFIVIGMFFASRALATGFVRYLQYNVKLVKGGLK